jgi:hypothetical protein
MKINGSLRRFGACTALALALATGALAGCASSRAQDAAQPLPPQPVSSTPALTPPTAADARYRGRVEADVADRLHLTPATIAAQLRATTGATLMNLAKPLGLTEDDLGPIIIASLDHAADSEARYGRWTAAQAGAERRYWTAQSPGKLITEVSAWFASR